ncbi:MAG: RNA-binding domain-containing protein [Candidatus Thorarchaeota archaeon]
MSGEFKISKILIEFSQHETESEQKLREALELIFINESLDLFDKFLQVQTLQGFHKNRIRLFRFISVKSRINSKLFKRIISLLNPVPQVNDLWMRFNDDDSSLYLRVNKQDLIRSQVLSLDEGSDIIKIVVKFQQIDKIVNFDLVIKKYINELLKG